jgi:DNA-binding response OmpR family regulator
LSRVLVADDSETILLLLRTRLEMEGYEVSTAVDGQEVIETLAGIDDDQKPDLILLDAMMPRMSGLDALRILRDEGSETPILIVSAHREEETLSRAEVLGADGCIPKPIDFEDLLGRIASLISSGRPRDGSVGP